jgi:hypothetical protein
MTSDGERRHGTRDDQRGSCPTRLQRREARHQNVARTQGVPGEEGAHRLAPKDVRESC